MSRWSEGRECPTYTGMSSALNHGYARSSVKEANKLSNTPVHPAVEPLAFLLGRWHGEGKGEYPTIEPFLYGEEIEFSHNGRPFLFYQQRTWNPADGYPLHSEAGYFRPVAEGRIELVLSQPSGITEILAGTISGQRIDLTSTVVGVSPTAKEVSAVKRAISVVGTTLSYQLDMAAVDQEMSIHLLADLEKQ